MCMKQVAIVVNEDAKRESDKASSNKSPVGLQVRQGRARVYIMSPKRFVCEKGPFDSPLSRENAAVDWTSFPAKQLKVNAPNITGFEPPPYASPGVRS